MKCYFSFDFFSNTYQYKYYTWLMSCTKNRWQARFGPVNVVCQPPVLDWSLMSHHGVLYFSWLLSPVSILILKIINAFSALLLPFPSLWPPTPCSVAPSSLSVLTLQMVKRTIHSLWNQHFGGKESGFQAVSPEIQTFMKKSVFFFLWCFLFLWFQISPATAEWQYFKQSLLDIWCSHI